MHYSLEKNRFVVVYGSENHVTIMVININVLSIPNT